MKLADIEQTAVEIKEKKDNARTSIAQKKAAAEARLNELVNQAESLAQDQQFDEYAANMEAQRFEKNIISAAEKISQRTDEQLKADKKAVREFYDQAQQAFDEDAAGDIKDLVKAINAAATAGEKIRAKVQRANAAREKVAVAYQVLNDYSGVNTVMNLINAAYALRQQLDILRSENAHGL